MKILLVTPIADSFMIIPDIGLGYIAASIRKKGFDVDILDCALLGFGFDDFERRIRQLRPDVVGFKVFSKDVPAVQGQLESIRDVVREAKIVVGGAHPSGVIEEIFKDFPGADFAFVGEGEEGFPALLDHLQRGEGYEEISGLVYKGKDGDVHHNPQEFIEDLDGLGFPAWDLIDPRKYPPAPEGSFAKSFPIAPIIATRGCPYRCTFCAVKNTTGRKIRYHSVDYVIDELELLYKEYGIKEFHFEDDNFTAKKNYVIDICKGIISRGMKIHWSCPNGIRLDTLDDEILAAMKRSGCYSVAVGIESASERIRERMMKKLDTPTIEEKVRLLRKHGIKVHGFFILGYPEETREDIEMSLKFSRKLPLNTVYFNIFNPFPGTRIYDELKAAGRLEGFDWATLAGETPSISVGDIDLDELKGLQKKAMFLFYLRPKTALEFLSRLRSSAQLRFIIKRIISVLFSSRG